MLGFGRTSHMVRRHLADPESSDNSERPMANEKWRWRRRRTAGGRWRRWRRAGRAAAWAAAAERQAPARSGRWQTACGNEGGGARGLLGDRKEQLELRRELLLGVQSVRKVDTPGRGHPSNEASCSQLFRHALAELASGRRGATRVTNFASASNWSSTRLIQVGQNNFTRKEPAHRLHQRIQHEQPNEGATTFTSCPCRANASDFVGRPIYAPALF